MSTPQPSISIEYHVAEVADGHLKRWEHTAEATVTCLEHGTLVDHATTEEADRVYFEHIEEHQLRGSVDEPTITAAQVEHTLHIPLHGFMVEVEEEGLHVCVAAEDLRVFLRSVLALTGRSEPAARSLLREIESKLEREDK